MFLLVAFGVEPQEHRVCIVRWGVGCCRASGAAINTRLGDCCKNKVPSQKKHPSFSYSHEECRSVPYHSKQDRLCLQCVILRYQTRECHKGAAVDNTMQWSLQENYFVALFMIQLKTW